MQSTRPLMGYSTLRSKSGQSTIELIGGLIILLPIVLCGVDLATMFFGSSLNANVCRDAARVASSGAPAASPLNGTLAASDPPKQRALQLVRNSQKTQGAIRLRTGDNDVVVSQNVTSMPTSQFGGIVNGTVTVQTTCDVYPPFLVARIMGRTSFAVSTTQTFPYTYVIAAATGAGNGPNTIGPNGTAAPPAPGNNNNNNNNTFTSTSTNTNNNQPPSFLQNLGGNTGGNTTSHAQAAAAH